MKNKLHYIIALFAFGIITNVGGQNGKEKRANDKFENYAFTDAINSYENLVKEGYSSEEVYKRLGNANYYNANYDVASEWYGRLIALATTETEPEYLYRYAQSLKSIKKYEESDRWMQKFEMAKTNDRRAARFVDNTDYLSIIKENSGRYTIENASFNSEVSDFAPSFHKEALVFSTARDTGITFRNIHKWNNTPFLNLYSAKVVDDGIKAIPFSKAINTKTHESSTAFTKDGNTAYFTRNNSKNGNFDRDAEGVSRLKLYRASWQNGEWGNITELSFNSDDYSVAHPALSPDERQLYFASDMPGTLGASDIFVVDIKADGSFSIPQNLGTAVNTEARETFPFVTASNVLYFASDGHPGLGGLDVFATNLEKIQEDYVVNVGEPVNSKEDDFSFILDESTKKGYFASNRAEGKGSDDIYSFIETSPIQISCSTEIPGIIKDEKTGNVIAGATVRIIDEKGLQIAETVSNDEGIFSLESTCAKGIYTLKASKEDYEDGDSTFELTNVNTPEVTILLSPIRKAAVVGADLAKILNLEPIYFDVNKAIIRDDAKIELNKVLEYMNTYPEIKVAIGSHTDSRGRDSYNLSLSDKRAKATMMYLISEGIERSRVTGKGYGESQLVNECGNGVKCSKAEHERNRRSEFIVTE